MNIFNVAPDNLYNKIAPDTFIEMVEESIKNSNTPIDKDHLTIVIIPSWLNCCEVLPLLSKQFHIRSVLTKINSNNFFSTKNLSLTENVLTFALPGYTQNVVVDTYIEEESLINSVMKVVGIYNK